MANVISKRSIVYDITFNTGTAKKGATDIGTAMKGAEKEIDKATASVNEFASKTLSAGARLKQIKNELNNFKGTEAQFQKLSLEAAKLSDQIQNTNRRISNLASSTRHIEAFASAFQGLTGVFTAVQGAQALFGKESENVQRALVKLQGSLALLQGVQAAVATVTEESAAKTAFMTAATKIYTFVTNGATVAAKAFRGALVGLGAGVVIAAIVAIYNAISDTTEAQKDHGKEIDKNKEKYKELQKAAEEYLESISSTLTGVEVVINKINSMADASNIIPKDAKKLLDQLSESAVNYFGGLEAGVSTYSDLAEANRKFKEALAVQSQIESETKALEALNLELFKLKEANDPKTGSRQLVLLSVEIPKATDKVQKLRDKLASLGGDPGVKGSLDKVEKEIKDIGDIIKFDPKRANDQENALVDSLQKASDTIAEVNDSGELEIRPQIDLSTFDELKKGLEDGKNSYATFAETIQGSSAEIGQDLATIFGNLASFAKDGSKAQIALSIANIVAAQAEALANAIKHAVNIPYPANIPAVLSSVALVTSLFAQVNSLISQAKGAQSGAEAFAEGEVDIHRAGEKRGKDSIPAVIMPGESVIKTERTKQYKPELLAIQDGRLEDLIHVNYVEPALALKALDNSKIDSTQVDYSDKFYRQYLATGEGNLTNKRAVKVLMSIDRKLSDNKKRYH